VNKTAFQAEESAAYRLYNAALPFRF